MKRILPAIAIIAVLFGIFLYSVVHGLVIVKVSSAGSGNDGFMISGPDGWKPMRKLGETRVGAFFVDGDQIAAVKYTHNSTEHVIPVGYVTTGSIQFLQVEKSDREPYRISVRRFP